MSNDSNDPELTENDKSKESGKSAGLVEAQGSDATPAMSHRAMFKLGGKILFVLCLLVKNLSAVYSADRCDF